MLNLWKWFLATFRLSDAAVCEMSWGLSPYSDYHDYKDAVEGHPDHFAALTCKRCGKNFYV